MTAFERALSTPEMTAVFGASSLLQAMLDVEAALARAEATEGAIPQEAAAAIAECCRVERYAVEAIVEAGAMAGSLAIPLVQALTREVGSKRPEAAAWVHWGSTSQDVIDTALVLLTRRGLALIETDLGVLCEALVDLAARQGDTPMLGRTLLQPAQVVSLSTELVAWVAPVVRTRERLRQAAGSALQLQLGGAVGTLEAIGPRGAAVSRRMAADLGLAEPQGPWHTQRDRWVSLACELGVLCGCLGKIARDLSLLSQPEIGEVMEPGIEGRGGSSAMPHKRNPVASMIALAAAQRAPQRVAALLAAMPQEHARGLGNWQAELAEWPGLLMMAHGAARALAGIAGRLEVDAARMRRNIDALHGLVFSEALSLRLAAACGKSEAHARVQAWSQQAVQEGRALQELVRHALGREAALAAALPADELAAAFDLDAVAGRADAVVLPQIDDLRRRCAALRDASAAAATLS